ncbi:hypothetical protein GJ496_004664 [Pomphorhynchus laevis]|nr:hypothetical protein GJ496_004664 [Pomphorhynchus laevis]
MSSSSANLDTEDANYKSIFEDKRVIYIRNILELNKSVTSEELFQVFSNPDTIAIIQRFLDTDEIPVLYFPGGENSLTIVYDPPAVITEPTLYIYKAIDGVVKESPEHHIKFGVITENFINDAYELINQVVIESFERRDTIQDWPDIAHWDCLQQLHQLRSNFGIVGLSLYGKMNLPTPSDLVQRVSYCDSNSLCGENLRAEIELCIDEWDNQVTSIIENDLGKVRDEMAATSYFTPIDELDYWKKRRDQLHEICEKINSEETISMIHYLELNESPQALRFESILETINDSIDQTNEAVKLLYAFEPAITKFESADDWPTMKNDINTIFTVLKILWDESVFYAKPDNFSVLLMNTADTIMKSISYKLNSTDILKKSERIETINLINNAKYICNTFDRLYHSSCEDIIEKQSGQSKSTTWSFAYSQIFQRWICYKDKLDAIKNIIQNSIEYDRFLELTSILPMTFILQNDITSLIESYNKLLVPLMEGGDPLEPSNNMFIVNYQQYQKLVEDKDLFMSVLLQQMYNQITDFEDKAKFLNQFWTIIKRPAVLRRFRSNFINFTSDLKAISNQRIYEFVRELKKSNVHELVDSPNIREIVLLLSASKFIKELETVCNNFDSMIIKDSDRLTILERLCQLNNEILSKEDKLLRDWNDSANLLCLRISDMPILRKSYNKEKHLAVNLPDTYCQVLKEIEFLSIYSESIAETENTIALINDAQEILKLAALLSELAYVHNEIRRTTDTAEFCLAEFIWLKFNEYISEATETLTWRDADLWQDKTAEAYENLKEVVTNLTKCRERVEHAFSPSQVLLQSMIIQPNTKSLDILCPDKRKFILSHFANVGQWADKVEHVLEEIHEDFEDADTEAWNTFTASVDMRVLHRLYEIVKLNIQSLYSVIIDRFTDQTVVTVNLKLLDSEIKCEPSLDISEPTGLYNELFTLIDDIIYQSGILKRIIEEDNPGSYQQVIEECKELIPLKNQIMEHSQLGIKEAVIFVSKLEVYSHLWKNNRDDFMKQFLQFSRILSERELKPLALDPDPSYFKAPSLQDIQTKIDYFTMLLTELESIPSSFVIQSWLKIETDEFKQAVTHLCSLWRNMFINYLISFVTTSLSKMSELVENSLNVFESKISKGNQSLLIKVSQHLKDFSMKEKETEALFDPITQVINVLRSYDRDIDEDTKEKFLKIHDQWSSLQIKAVHVKQQLTPYLADQIADFRLRLADLEQWQDKFRSSFIGYGPFHQNIPEHYERIDTLNETIDSKLKEVSDLRETSAVFDMAIPEFKQLNQCKEELYAIKQLWDIIDIITSSMAYWRTTTWKDANIEMIEQTLKQKFLLKELRGLSKACGKWDNFIRIESEVKNMLSAIRVISELKTDSMRDRHWNELMESTTGFFFRIDDSMKLDDLLRLNLHAYEDQVRDIVEKSIKELSMEKTLNEISALWKSATFDVVEHERTGTSLLVARDDIIESLDDHQNQLQMMATSKYADYFANDLQYWQTQLAAVDQVLRKLIDVQKTWSYLETIFMGTQDIRAKLPKETRQFHILDSDFKNICKSNMEDLNIVRCMNRPGLLDLFESIERRLAQSQKALEGYLETKRIMFPRFYFVSPSELLDILSNGTDPSKVMHLLIKLFDSIDKLELEPVNLSSEADKPSSKKTRKSSTKSGHYSRDSSQLRHKRKHHHSTSSRRRDKHHKQAKSANKFATDDSVRDQQKKSVLINEVDDNDEPEGTDDDEDTEDVSEEDDFTMMMNEVTTEDPISVFATGMYSDEGEFVKFMDKYLLEGQVEYWINTVLQAMKNSIRHWLKEAVSNYEHQNREAWIGKYPAQIVLTGSQIWWTSEVNAVFQSIETNPNALKDYLKKQMNQLNALIKLLLGDLNELDRQKITTLCLIDLHARDIVEKMINAKIDNAGDFMWQSQLRLRWSDQQNHCFADICDANFLYQYEYLGNKSRLVITPLTDRCYITLTQSLHLYMGGAPAGPAGTGKTETTKDLGRTLGVKVVVSNCSEQMDYSSLGNLFKGLAQSGLWGCFDEFNRITADVLSVVSIQVKTILYALRSRKERFDFMGADIALNSSVGIFITMNPGYAGRTELPENMKALFRPCAMIVPDFDLITELNLVSAGFTEAKVLSRKFVTLYSLCRDLLSKQDHYDWGLRAIKSVLVVAGNLRRADPDLPENMVLMRALRDFNVPKITNDDLSIFLGLIQDLFPALDVPRKQDANLEKYIKQAASELKLQYSEHYASNFVLKVVQLKELLEVRHSVFIVGEAGSGKSCVWKTLQHAYRLMSQRPIAIDLNPKAVTNDELFGVVNKTTREWRDGI